MPTDDSSRTVDALISLLRDMVEQIRVVRNHAGLGVYRSLYLHCAPQMTHLDPIFEPKASRLIELIAVTSAEYPVLFPVVVSFEGGQRRAFVYE